jgi:hypothetical protein
MTDLPDGRADGILIMWRIGSLVAKKLKSPV